LIRSARQTNQSTTLPTPSSCRRVLIFPINLGKVRFLMFRHNVNLKQLS
jgi:hypothetical protein